MQHFNAYHHYISPPGKALYHILKLLILCGISTRASSMPEHPITWATIQESMTYLKLTRMHLRRQDLSTSKKFLANTWRSSHPPPDPIGSWSHQKYSKLSIYKRGLYVSFLRYASLPCLYSSTIGIDTNLNVEVPSPGPSGKAFLQVSFLKDWPAPSIPTSLASLALLPMLDEFWHHHVDWASKHNFSSELKKMARAQK